MLYIFALIFFLSHTKPVYAYLDPGTGSYVFQLLIAGLFGSLFFVKSIIRKIRQSLKKHPKKVNPEDENDN